MCFHFLQLHRKKNFHIRQRYCYKYNIKRFKFVGVIVNKLFLFHRVIVRKRLLFGRDIVRNWVILGGVIIKNFLFSALDFKPWRYFQLYSPRLTNLPGIHYIWLCRVTFYSFFKTSNRISNIFLSKPCKFKRKTNIL